MKRDRGPDPAGLSARVLPWILQAGQWARRGFQRTNFQIKTDRTLRVPVEVEIAEYLTACLRAAYPDQAILTEENPAEQRLEHDQGTWVIDPLDGTTAFVKGLPIWGIAVGLLWGGTPVWGAFYMPWLDDLTYLAEEGLSGGPRWNTGRSPTTRWEDHSFLAASMGAHANFQIEVPRICATGSTGANLVYTARGTAAAAFIPKAYVWDLVAGACLLNAAGGELRYLSGQRVEYEALLDGRRAPEPILAGHPRLLDALRGRIRPRPDGARNDDRGRSPNAPLEFSVPGAEDGEHIPSSPPDNLEKQRWKRGWKHRR